MACCPAHDDKDPSLSVTDTEDDKVLVHCHAGCPFPNVAHELRKQNLWPEPTDEQRQAAKQRRQQKAVEHAETVLMVAEDKENLSSKDAQTVAAARITIATQGQVTEWQDIIPIPEQGDIGESALYPIDQLPEATRKAAEEVAQFSKVHVALPAIVGLAVHATAIGKKAIVEELRSVQRLF